MLKNSTTRYGLISILVHWLVAIIIIGLFIVGYWMVGLTYYSEWYRIAPHWHKSIGILLAFMMLFRLAWRCFSPTPAAISTHKPWERIASHLTHILLYILIFLVLISGYLISTADGRGIMVFNWFEIPSLGTFIINQESIAGNIHRYAAYSLIGLAVLHAIAAIKHHVIDKDQTLKRMLGH